MLSRVLGNKGLCVIFWVSAGGCDQTLHSLLLILPGLVVEQDTQCDKDGANGRQASDFVSKNDDAEPDRQGVLHSTGDTERHRGDLSHQGICSDTLKVKQGAICQQQQHDVLAVAEALPTPSNHRDIHEEGPCWNEQGHSSSTGVELQFRGPAATEDTCSFPCLSLGFYTDPFRENLKNQQSRTMSPTMAVMPLAP